MTATPGTQQTELDEAVAEAIEAALAVCESDEGVQPETVLTDVFMEHLTPVLAEIRRHAAADALKEQARGLDKQGAFFSTMKLSAHQKGDARSAEIWAVHAERSHGDANRLHRAAADKIAEGYAFECAAFSQECETRVPDAGDYCAKHDPEDEEDRWSA